MNVKILILSGFIRTLESWAGELQGFSDSQIPNAYFKIKQLFTYTSRFSFQTIFFEIRTHVCQTCLVLVYIDKDKLEFLVLWPSLPPKKLRLLIYPEFLENECSSPSCRGRGRESRLGTCKPCGKEQLL